jgi:iron complex transport system permease protein
VTREATRSRSLIAFAGAALALPLLVIASMWLGSGDLSPATVWRVLWHPDDSTASAVVRELRWPRTLLALVVGAALGLAGALMQSLTRNPLADPGILGVNAGAAVAVVSTVAFLGAVDIGAYVWSAFAGAAVAGLAVYVLGAVGHSRTAPARLALAGVAISAALGAAIQAVILLDQVTFNEFRFWAAG